MGAGIGVAAGGLNMGSGGKAIPPYAGIDATIDADASAAVVKSHQLPGRLFLMGIMAGLYIGIGFWLAFTVSSAFWPTKVKDFADGKLVTEAVQFSWPGNPSMLVRFLLGAVFPVGLISVLIGGAELWTGCAHVIPVGYMEKKLGLKELLYNWICSYGGNFVGSVILAFMATYGTKLFLSSPTFDEVVSVAYVKSTLDPWTAFWRGIGCNFLVNLAVWLWLRSRGDFMGQAFLIWFPIFAFVTIGFEHSIANMFAIPAGMYAAAINMKYVVTYRDFFFGNLLPVTYGNLVGGFLFIAFVYWFTARSQVKSLEGLKNIIDILIVAGLIFTVLEVLIPALLAVGVESALGLSAGAVLADKTLALLPAVVASIYYLVMPFIAFRVLKPLG